MEKSVKNGVRFQKAGCTIQEIIIVDFVSEIAADARIVVLPI